jgi:hypothetical protein
MKRVGLNIGVQNKSNPLLVKYVFLNFFIISNKFASKVSKRCLYDIKTLSLQNLKFV